MSENAAVPTDRRALLAGLGGLAAGTFLAAGRAEAGPLTPPAAPAPTGKPLAEVEPRIAINAANTPGDTNSTFKITQSGSYYLTGNIKGASGRHGIEIAADNVTIDLMGFALLGSAGTLDGIAAEGTRNNLVIRNGTISGWGSGGINLVTSGTGFNALVEGIIASANGGVGIQTNANAVARGCVAQANGGRGINVLANGVVANCSTRQNGGNGIQAGEGSTVTSCSASDNTGTGIQIGRGGTVTDSSAYNNTGSGIQIDLGATVTDCSANGNTNNGIQAENGCTVTDCSASNNTGTGIRISSGNLVRDNVCRGNGVAGIAGIGIDNRIEGNNCMTNGRGIHLTGTGNIIARNTCSGNTTANWDIAANNKCLVVNGTNAAAINGDSGGASFGSTNPNANFTY